ncbi:spermidine/putrescine ABC transporter substrate-binding protein [Mycoplasma ovis str. Michigan]|uniref:Spermidine/putrescine ABC transporter substrate-binding protein n=1 Tax=Mycoplasma ovis str. Michigan TaxID=1415773 RepID=A0ABM5P091_9MOLU|nr:spermidine/putrescine ABC transporter substrate-binding protein [Mycoplasma ovis]AHC39826.1 spermidine/putrescine ABC transporter substrate-binding protein [Mycoplasma ovis str. Michigan]
MGLAKFFLIPSTGVMAIPISLMSLNTEIDDEIVLATYQSYINADIADQAFNDYSLKTIYFENDKEVFNGFASGAFDLAILSSSTLEEAISKNLAKKIDWKKFKSIQSKLGNGGTSNEGISKKLGQIYSPVVSKFFENAPELANYGIPYFISYFAFAYRGKPLEGSSSTETTTVRPNSTLSEPSQKTPMSWYELMQKISKDDRFKSKEGEPKLGMVEDELTLFSLSKLSNKTAGSNNSSEIEQLFKKEETTSEDDFYKQYIQINESGINKEVLGERPLFFSPDSVVLSEALSSGNLQGIFFYNGDALYAHQMLEEEKEESEEESEEETINVVPLSPALWFLDSIVISSKSSPEKEEGIYQFLEKLSFENFDKFEKLNRKQELSGEETDNKDTKEEKRPEWLLGNFTEIGYTPVLQEFNKWIKGEKTNPPSPAPEGDGDFYKKEKEFLYGEPDMEKCLEGLKQKKEANEKNCFVVFERGLNDSQNLNLALAFERWKNNF